MLHDQTIYIVILLLMANSLIGIDMKIAILSDIHGNYSALEAVFDSLNGYDIDRCVILGDMIDNCMHSNECVKMIKESDFDITAILGNHDYAALYNDFTRFSTERGIKSSMFTSRTLNNDSREYLQSLPRGFFEFISDGKRCLALHGSYEDPLWGKLTAESELIQYSGFDYVFTGHTHVPHFFERYFETDNPQTRNLKKTIFINPGSVGQPRNINPLAQYSIIDTTTEQIHMMKIPYNVEKEQNSFTDDLDPFYRERLKNGI